MRMIRIAGPTVLLLGMLAAEQCRADVPAASAEWVDDLRPIAAADWSRERAAHLLERAGFGATNQTADDNLMHTCDFRHVYATVADGWLGLSNSAAVPRGQLAPFSVFS